MQQSAGSSPVSCKEPKHSWVKCNFFNWTFSCIYATTTFKTETVSSSSFQRYSQCHVRCFYSPVAPGGGIGGGGKPGGPGNGGGGGSPGGKLPGGGIPGGRCIPAGGAPNGCGGGGWYDIVAKRKTNFEELLKAKERFWLSTQHGRSRARLYECMVGSLIPSFLRL